MPAEKATVSVFDRGLVLGDGLFETLRARGGKPEFLPLHYRRLAKSAKRLRIAVPATEMRLRAIIAELCRKSRMDDAAVRITLTRGRYAGGLAIDPAVPPTLIVVVMPVSPLPAAVEKRGVKVAISSINKAAASGLDPRVKSLNYLANIFAKAEGDARGCYEAILLGARGEIAELSTSSFFCVIREGVRDVVVTPPIDTGILPGITRQVLLREMKRERIPFREGDVFPADARRMTEALLCSSVRGPVAITRIEGRKIGKGVPGPVFAKLLSLYAKACEKEVTSYE
ncbi:MAG TPA: aminotransferase class IV [Fibrobacteria bacterium]|nr:aminotransferase class IV [Fibrobacteria bacterium]